MKYNAENNSCGEFATSTARAKAIKELESRLLGVKPRSIVDELTPPNVRLEKEIWKSELNVVRLIAKSDAATISGIMQLKAICIS